MRSAPDKGFRHDFGLRYLSFFLLLRSVSVCLETEIEEAQISGLRYLGPNIWFRTSAAQILSPHITSRLFLREIQAALALGVFVAIKIVREETWEGFISDTLFFAKIFLLALTLIMDYHLTLWYAVIFAVIYIFTQQPAFKKLGTSSKITPLQLESLLTEGSTSRLWLLP
ncbi:hypothetical protein ACLB2K_012173 [Fragaria x ananassa]